MQIGEEAASSAYNSAYHRAMSGASSAMGSAAGAIGALKSIFGGMGSGGGSASSASGSISPQSVNCPSAPGVSVDTGGAPMLGGLMAFSIPAITIPSYTIIAPEAVDLGYNEAAYHSDIQDVLKAALVDFIENGGTGINANVEAALWERSRDRQTVINERLYYEANNYTMSRGYNLQGCIATGLLVEAQTEQVRADAQLEHEILIEQARLARSQVDYVLQAGLTLEGQEKEHFNNIANRALDCAKASVQVIIDLYFAKISAYSLEVEAAKMTAEIARLQAEIVIAKNENIVDAYEAKIDIYKTRLLAEIRVIETVVKIYGYEVMGFEAEAKAEVLKLEAQVKQHQGNVVNDKNSAVLSLKEAEMTIQQALGELQVSVAESLADGRVQAQWTAGMLGINNASSRVAANISRTASNLDDDTTTDTNSNSYSAIHRYDETN